MANIKARQKSIFTPSTGTLYLPSDDVCRMANTLFSAFGDRQGCILEIQTGAQIPYPMVCMEFINTGCGDVISINEQATRNTKNSNQLMESVLEDSRAGQKASGPSVRTLDLSQETKELLEPFIEREPRSTRINWDYVLSERIVTRYTGPTAVLSVHRINITKIFEEFYETKSQETGGNLYFKPRIERGLGYGRCLLAIDAVDTKLVDDLARIAGPARTPSSLDYLITDKY